MNTAVIWQLLLQACLIALNALFASAEVAVASLNETKLRRWSDEGDEKAEKMLNLLDHAADFSSTLRIGITLAGFLSAAFAANSFSELLVQRVMGKFAISAQYVRLVDAIAVIVITLILAILTLVLGVLVPQKMAMQRPFF